MSDDSLLNRDIQIVDLLHKLAKTHHAVELLSLDDHLLLRSIVKLRVIERVDVVQVFAVILLLSTLDLEAAMV